MTTSERARLQVAPSPALIAGTSVREAASLLFGLLLDVARRHRPEVETVLEGRAIISDLTPEAMARALQAQGIWFQLLSIADQNAAMRRRRFAERNKGREQRARHLLKCARRGVANRHRRRGDPEAARQFAHQAGAHRASDRVEARHGVGEVPQDLSLAARAREPALDQARAGRHSRRDFATRSSSCG